MTDNPQPDRSLRAVLTVTVETRPDGGHYFDQADFTAHATEWVRAALKGQHAVDEVTVVDQAAELARAQAEAHQYRTALQGVARAAADRAASTAPLAAGLPVVQGRCPACGVAGLFLGSGGYVTCSSADCPEPDAATTVLERRRADEAQQPDAPRQWCKCPSCWGWFVEEHPGEDLDELGKDLRWWSGLPEHRDAPAAVSQPGKEG